MRIFDRTLLIKIGASLAVVAMTLAFSVRADASLSVLEQDTGNVAVTQDGCGSTTQACSISLSVPVGSTVVNAYLFSAYYNFGAPTPFNPSVTLNGNAVSLGPDINNATACCGIGSAVANVTSIVAPVVNGGSGSYTFNITEGGSDGYTGTDGEALVIVYSNPAIATATVGILNGFASVTGDTTTINFASPLHPGAAGFTATMGIGDSFSCCYQESTITVDGQTLTTVAGNNDDSKDAYISNGNLITVGGPNDGFTVASPGSPASDYNSDHEYYDLTPFITDGDTSITVNTINASQDDNIFLATFDVTGLGGVNKPPPSTVPEPSTLSMLGLGLIGLAWAFRQGFARV
jgi:PEP-CTERM motif